MRNLYKIIYVVVFVLLNSKSLNAQNTAIDKIIIDFELSLKTFHEKSHRECFLCDKKEELAKIRQLYIRNHYSQLVRSITPKIPKIIHHIWIGPKPMPEIVEPLRKTWMEFHPGFTFMLWTNETVKKMVWFSKDIETMYNLAQSPLEKADLLRLQVLYTYGGIYTDADQRCLKSFEELNHYYDFFVGTVSDARDVVFPNGLIGSTAAHPLLKYLLENIAKMQINQKTPNGGVKYFSNELRKMLYDAPGVNIALPPTVFYSVPYGYQARGAGASDFVLPESMIINYWGWSTKFWEKKSVEWSQIKPKSGL